MWYTVVNKFEKYKIELYDIYYYNQYQQSFEMVGKIFFFIKKVDMKM